jgi:hypothetical protein
MCLNEEMVKAMGFRTEHRHDTDDEHGDDPTMSRKKIFWTREVGSGCRAW